jgi:hypothetical protein
MVIYLIKAVYLLFRKANLEQREYDISGVAVGLYIYFHEGINYYN